MKEIDELCPRPPDWRLDWDEIDRRFAWVRALRGCEQSPVWHAEGDVWTHTRMVCEVLAGLERFRALPEDDRGLAFAAALLHDIGKPARSRAEADGRITSRGHSGLGERMARLLLWRAGTAFARRELVCGLIRFHQLPFFAIDRADAERQVFRASLVARCDLLAILAEADGTGRRCADRSEQRTTLDNVELFRELCRERDCLTGPRRFASDHSRFLYFRKTDRDPSYLAYDDTRCEVVLLAGLPGSGKDTAIAGELPHLPVVSLDQVREELGARPGVRQGPVAARARELAREHLRAGRDFVWNATNLKRNLRTQLIDFFAGYGARVRIIYLEADEATLEVRNRGRATPLPKAAVQRMLNSWTVPDLSEAHRVKIRTANATHA